MASPAISLTNNDPQVVEYFFNAVYMALGTTLLMIIANHFQISGQSERIGKTVISRLLHYICDHQEDKNTCI